MARQLQSMVVKNALWFSIIVTVLSVALLSLPIKGLFAPPLGDQQATYLARLTTRLVVSALLIGLLAWLRWSKPAGFVQPGKGINPWLVWPALLLIVFNLSDWLLGSLVITAPAGLVGSYLAYNLSTGLFEETLFRGVVVTALVGAWGGTKAGILRAVLVAGLIFGLAHSVNLLSNPGAVIATLSQLVYTFCLGVFFAAALLRNRSIWPVMIAHALINISSDLVELTQTNGIQAGKAVAASLSLADAALPILLTLPLLLYGLYLLRKVEPPVDGHGNTGT